MPKETRPTQEDLEIGEEEKEKGGSKAKKTEKAETAAKAVMRDALLTDAESGSENWDEFGYPVLTDAQVKKPSSGEVEKNREPADIGVSLDEIKTMFFSEDKKAGSKAMEQFADKLTTEERNYYEKNRTEIPRDDMLKWILDRRIANSGDRELRDKWKVMLACGEVMKQQDKKAPTDKDAIMHRVLQRGFERAMRLYRPIEDAVSAQGFKVWDVSPTKLMAMKVQGDYVISMLIHPEAYHNILDEKGRVMAIRLENMVLEDIQKKKIFGVEFGVSKLKPSEDHATSALESMLANLRDERYQMHINDLRNVISVERDGDSPELRELSVDEVVANINKVSDEVIGEMIESAKKDDLDRDVEEERLKGIKEKLKDEDDDE